MTAVTYMHDARDRIAFAQEKLDLVRSEIELLTYPNANSVMSEVDENSVQYVFYVNALVPIPVSISTAVSDIVVNARHALNGLASAVSAANGGPRDCVFPIALTKPDFDALNIQPTGMPLTEVERLQPYNMKSQASGIYPYRLTPWVPQQLMNLNTLYEANKARLLRPTWMPHWTKMSKDHPLMAAQFESRMVQPQVDSDELKAGAQIAYADPKVKTQGLQGLSDMDVNAAIAFDVVVNIRPTVVHVPTDLAHIIDAVDAVLTVFEPVIAGGRAIEFA